MFHVVVPYNRGEAFVEAETPREAAVGAVLQIGISRVGSVKTLNPGHNYINVLSEDDKSVESFDLQEILDEASVEHKAFEECCHEIADLLGISSASGNPLWNELYLGQRGLFIEHHYGAVAA